MSKKEDLKLVFDFIADFLKDEKPVEEKHVEEKHVEERVSKVEPKKTKSDKNIEHMLEIMKRVDVMDGVRKTAPVIPHTERDEDVVVSRIQEVMARPKLKKETGADMSYLKSVLDDARVVNNAMNETHPIFDSTEKPGQE
jgi:2-methylisocitrate lyase-like PEP mutase family enzyme